MKINVLRIENLAFQYLRARNPALSAITCQFKEGERILLMGKTGAGKSTFCLCLKGLIPDIIPGTFSGTIFHNLSEIHASENSIGLVLQEFEAQLFNSTVELEVAFGLQNIGISRPQMHRTVSETLRKIGLGNHEKMSPLSLSGGQKQRLAIASIWAMNPDIFILDEPMTDLDTEGRQSVFEMILQLSETGKTIVLVDNDLEYAAQFDRALIMDHGTIVYDMTPEESIRHSLSFILYGIRPPDRVVIFNELNLGIEQALTREKAFEALHKQFRSIEFPVFSHETDTTMTDKAIINIKEASFTYPSTGKGIFDLNVSIHQGEFIGLIGANGSGKTTLLKLMTGSIAPDRGAVHLAQKCPHTMPPGELPHYIGFVFQNPDHQIFASSIKEELLQCMNLAGIDEHLQIPTMQEVLKTVKLEGYEDEDPFLLTKGERQKVAIASALINNPAIVILDEPTTGLDYQEQLSILSMLTRLNKQGKTIIITTHSLWIIEAYAHRCIIMHQGRIASDATVQQTFSNPHYIEELGLLPPELSLLCHSLNVPFMRLQDLIAMLKSRL
jgi:energy-coupling factor transport system ATP-binding protein